MLDRHLVTDLGLAVLIALPAALPATTNPSPRGAQAALVDTPETAQTLLAQAQQDKRSLDS